FLRACSQRRNAEIFLGDIDNDGLEHLSDDIQPSTSRLNLLASGVNDRSDPLDVVGQTHRALEPRALLRMPLPPVDGHKECAPRHSRIDDVAEGKIVEALKYLAHLAIPRNENNLPEDKDWPQPAQQVENVLEEPKMIEKIAKQSITKHAKGEAA